MSFQVSSDANTPSPTGCQSSVRTVPRSKMLRQNSLPSPPSNNSYSQREPFAAVATAKPRLSRVSYLHAVISYRTITHSPQSAPTSFKGRSVMGQESGGGGQGSLRGFRRTGRGDPSLIIKVARAAGGIVCRSWSHSTAMKMAPATASPASKIIFGA